MHSYGFTRFLYNFTRLPYKKNLHEDIIYSLELILSSYFKNEIYGVISDRLGTKYYVPIPNYYIKTLIGESEKCIKTSGHTFYLMKHNSIFLTRIKYH